MDGGYCCANRVVVAFFVLGLNCSTSATSVCRMMVVEGGGG